MSVSSSLLTGALADAWASVAIDAVLVVDDQSWRVVAANQAAMDLFGGELGGMAVEALFRLEGEQSVERFVWRARTLGPLRFVDFERADGVMRVVDVRATRVELAGCTACVLSLRDRTRERDLERDLEEATAGRGALLDALGIGVLTIDSSGRIVDHNHFRPLLDVFGETLAGRNFFLDVAAGPAARSSFQQFQEWVHRLDGGAVREVFEFDLGRRTIEAELVTGAASGAGAAMVRLTDLTERRLVEAEFRRQTFEAEEAARRARLVYQTANLIHQSLDLSVVLETAVAETGRLLGASRCLVISLVADGMFVVTHEYRRLNLPSPAPFDGALEANPVLAEVIRSLQPVAVESADLYPPARESAFSGAVGAAALVLAPIAVNRQARGVLAIVQCDRRRSWSSGDVDLAASIATQAGLAISHAEIHERVRRQAEREAIVARLAVILHGAGDFEQALKRAAAVLLGALEGGGCSIACEEAGGVPGRAWSWTRRADGAIVSVQPPDGGVEWLASRAGGDGSYVATFGMREGGRGVVVVQPLGGRGGVTDATAILEAVAVHVGVAIAGARLFDAITQAKRMWEGTFDAMPDGIALHDETFVLLRVNAAFARLFRATPARLVGKTMLPLLASDNRAALCEARELLRSEGVPVTLDLAEPGLGRMFQVTLSSFSGLPSPSFIVTFRDVTERRRLRERLEESAKMATMGNLAAGVAHEINTPLATISGSAQSLSRQLAVIPELVESERWPGIRDRLDAMVAEAFRCKKITHDLLDFAAPTRPSFALTDVVRVAREAVDTVERDRPARRVRVDARRTVVFAWTDPDLLRQVLINLVANAVDAVEEKGSGTVRVEAIRRVGEAVIRVTDTGPGIAGATIGRIFDPFFTTKAPGRGTGLGLSISRNIVVSLGGRLEARNRPRRGAAFTVCLPASGPAVDGRREVIGDDEQS